MVKILYVEDEPFLGKIVKESLESRGFELCWIKDGAEVMAAFDQFNPDICVLDVMLPNRDGFDLGREIRNLDTITPIIYLTAKDQTADVLKGFNLGGNDYLRKPFSQEELIARINNLLSLVKKEYPATPEKEDEDVKKIGNYTFHFKRQQLTHPDLPARTLSHRETQLLGMLTQKPNAIIERKTLLLNIWGNDSIFNSRNLDVYITRLRDYFREDPAIQILTLKGVGYRFVCTN